MECKFAHLKRNKKYNEGDLDITVIDNKDQVALGSNTLFFIHQEFPIIKTVISRYIFSRLSAGELIQRPAFSSEMS